MKYIDKILQTKKTIFSYQDLEIILWIDNKNTLKKIFERMVEANIMKRIQKWLYAFLDYNRYELAVKLKKNSYISFETVLYKEWVVFQDYADIIFLASDNTEQKEIENQQFVFLKLKNSILQNPIWLIKNGKYFIATKERAICDRLYLSKNYYFDNLENIDRELLENISKIYNKRVILEVKNIIQNAW